MTDLTILLLMLMMGASPATHLAQPGTSSTPRIDHGVASGALTEKEATRLQKEQDRVQKAEDKAMEDGKVTKMERARIERRQDQASEHIYSQKHDRQRAN